jgi:hypothetical protein
MTEEIEFDTLNSSGFNPDMDIDALFASARSDAPVLEDDNFTKIVTNSLPERPLRRQARGVSFVVLGLFFAFQFFNVGRVVSGLVNLIPESITLSPLHALIGVLSVSIMSFAAWWTVENNRG